ncbi:hypothetical protein [Streptomyces sp. MST-110588]|uniref:hypothetical protein n=1 Tax=Streptomyces sp. MST-110588 TaxID=2833628 RepID=UPI001F5C4673|nr:hypothetical protein [Streptomyces sp. MST-110588]
MIALASTVALAIALPLAAATAGPAESGRAEPAKAVPGPSERSGARDAPSSGRSRTPYGAGEPLASAAGGSADAGPFGRTRKADGELLAGLGLSPGGTAVRHTARCGPELASPAGVEAQTCVVAADGRTWARTYYRNTSGAPLRAELTLMRPDGGTVQAHCEVPAGDEPGTCETPAERTVQGLDGGRGGNGEAAGSEAGSGLLEGRAGEEGAYGAYSAVAEVSDVDGERLLLRAGSNSTLPARGSDQ